MTDSEGGRAPAGGADVHKLESQPELRSSPREGLQSLRWNLEVRGVMT